MYKRTTNHKSHKRYSIEEKNQIVLLYLDHHMGQRQIYITFDLPSKHTIYDWVKQYKTYGTCTDNRGKCTKLENENKGRPRKTLEKTLEEYTKEELIERCRLLEDIKKSVACLEISKQKKSIKS